MGFVVLCDNLCGFADCLLHNLSTLLWYQCVVFMVGFLATNQILFNSLQAHKVLFCLLWLLLLKSLKLPINQRNLMYLLFEPLLKIILLGVKFCSYQWVTILRACLKLTIQLLLELLHSVLRHWMSQKSLCEGLAKTRTAVWDLMSEVRFGRVRKHMVELIEVTEFGGSWKWRQGLVVFELIDKRLFGFVENWPFHEFTIGVEIH